MNLIAGFKPDPEEETVRCSFCETVVLEGAEMIKAMEDMLLNRPSSTLLKTYQEHMLICQPLRDAYRDLQKKIQHISDQYGVNVGLTEIPTKRMN